MQNKPEEQNPWPIIMKIAPLRPQPESVKIPPITKDMWATEDKATKNLISVWRRQINLATTPPIIVQLIKAQFKVSKGAFSFGIRRIKPYPPNFKRTPASIIEPATGAST